MQLLLEGREIEIVKANEDYAEKFYEYLQLLKDDPENYTIIRYDDVTLEDVKKIRWNDYPMFLAIEKEKVVGSIQVMRGKYFGISRQPHVAEIAYSIAKEFRGKGLIYALMFYALSNVSIVTAWVDERNIRSQKVLEKLGARKLGKIDDFMYSIREKSFVNMIFYVGNAEEMRIKAKEEAERKGIKL